MNIEDVVVIDLESTGTNVQEDRIVQIALVTTLGTVFTSLVDPGIPIPEEASKVHGITDETIRSARAPAFKEMADQVYRILQHQPIGGYSIRSFDLPMLVAEFERCGLQLNLTDVPIIDGKNIFYALEPRDLEAAYKRYVDAEGFEGAHGAEADATATARLLEALVGLPEVPSDSLQELHAFCDTTGRYKTEVDRWWRKEDGHWVFDQGKHKGVRLQDAPKDYLNWMWKKIADKGVREVLRVEADRRTNSEQMSLLPQV